MYKIQANKSGTRNIEVTDEHLQTIQRYKLLDGLVDSNGIIDDNTLNKLRFNIRSILESETGKDKALLDLCLDVVYSDNMKVLGLTNLVALYSEWNQETSTETEE